jgi:hypothetical protein
MASHQLLASASRVACTRSGREWELRKVTTLSLASLAVGDAKAGLIAAAPNMAFMVHLQQFFIMCRNNLSGTLCVSVSGVAPAAQALVFCKKPAFSPLAWPLPWPARHHAT